MFTLYASLMTISCTHQPIRSKYFDFVFFTLRVWIGLLSLTHAFTNLHKSKTIIIAQFVIRSIFHYVSLPFFSFIFSFNLYELIKKNNYQGFSVSLIRRFCSSIIKCLKLLYQENIIHCDLKPVSLLVFFK